jgi:hypothetical protein
VRRPARAGTQFGFGTEDDPSDPFASFDPFASLVSGIRIEDPSAAFQAPVVDDDHPPRVVPNPLARQDPREVHVAPIGQSQVTPLRSVSSAEEQEFELRDQVSREDEKVRDRSASAEPRRGDILAQEEAAPEIQIIDPTTFGTQFQQEARAQAARSAPARTDRSDRLRGISARGEALDRVFGDRPFETTNFNFNEVRNALTGAVDNQGRLLSDEKDAQERAVAVIGEVLADGVQAARESGNPSNLTRVLATVASAVNTVSAPGQPFHGRADSLVDTVDELFNSILSTEEGKEVDEVKFNADDIDVIFGTNLSTLEQSNLPLQEIQSVRTEFARDLLLRGSNVAQLQRLQEWVEDHVASPVLQQTLENDVAQRIRVLQVQGSESLRPLPQLLPVSSEQVVSIQPPVRAQLVSQLQERLSLHEIEFRSAQNLGQRQSVLQEIRADIAGLNDFFDRHRITLPGQRDVLRIRDQPGTAEQGINVLRNVRQQLGNLGIQFAFVPRRAEGRPVNPQDLVRDLIRTLSHSTQSATRLDAKLIHDHHKTQKLGSIQIHTDASNGDKEIEIPHNVLMHDLLRLGQALSIEDGVLLDHNMNNKFTITYNKTTVGQIVAHIQELFRKHGGHDLRILYKPASGVGAFVGGALSQVFNRPMTSARQTEPGTQGEVMEHRFLAKPLFRTTHYGGGFKLSDVAAKIGGISGGVGVLFPAAAPIALPLAAGSAIISGIGKLFGL